MFASNDSLALALSVFLSCSPSDIVIGSREKKPKLNKLKAHEVIILVTYRAFRVSSDVMHNVSSHVDWWTM